MPGDALERDERAGRVAVARAAGGRDGHLALGGHGVNRELPADEPCERVHRHRRLGDRREVPEAGDAGRHAVVALGLGSHDGRLDSPRATLEHLAVLVDEEVVADVVPPVAVAVVARNGQHDRGRVLRVVVVRGHRVMNERELDLAVDRSRARRHCGGAPRRARDDRGRARLGDAGDAAAEAPRQPARHARGRERAHEARAQAARVAAQAQLELVGGADEGGVGAGRGAPAVRPVVARRVQRRPLGPAAATAAGAYLRLGRGAVRPRQADEVEAPRRVEHATPPPAAGRGGRGTRREPVERQLEQRGGACCERRGGRAEPGRRGDRGAGAEDLPAGEGTAGHDGLQHLDRPKGPHFVACTNPCGR